jgi:hypothetical protein
MSEDQADELLAVMTAILKSLEAIAWNQSKN